MILTPEDMEELAVLLVKIGLRAEYKHTSTANELKAEMDEIKQLVERGRALWKTIQNRPETEENSLATP